MKLLILGAGLVNRSVIPPLVRLLAARGEQALEVHVFDRGAIRAEHLEHPAYRGAEPGEAKAAALARALRDGVEGESGSGQRVTIRAFHGNLTRWPGLFLCGDLALVGLANEPARLAAQRLLRRAGTPAVIAGVSDAAGVFVLGGEPEGPCYACSAQEHVPLTAIPCVAGTAKPVSTRDVARADCLGWLGRAVPEICLDALGGVGLGSVHSFAAGVASSARIARDPACFGAHALAPVPDRELMCDLSATTVAELVAHCGAPQPERCSLHGTFRDDYDCLGCGRAGLSSSDLIRQWPQRERCASCGSVEVVPRVLLAGVAFREAQQRGWAGQTLRDLGTPPGGELTLTTGASSVRVRDTGHALESNP